MNDTMIPVICSTCGLKILVPISVQGREGRCLNCAGIINVPVQNGAPTLSSLDFNPGEVINDRYVIKALIGKGGMGVVYHATDTLVKEDVALKFLRKDMLRTEKARKLFLQEAQIARRLGHENIIAVHDIAFTGAGTLFISMEYARGKSLRELLMKHREQKRHIPPSLIVTIALQVLDALHFAHRLVVHRDIKPENILLLPNERVKVLDFGLAKAIEEEESSIDPQYAKQKLNVIGTFTYASPEQIHHRAVDLRADIFSMGVVLRELLTLRTPREYPLDKPIKRDDIPPEVVQVINKAVCEDKHERWQSARDFHNALKSAFEQTYKRIYVLKKHSVTHASTEGMVYFSGGTFLMGNKAVREESPEEEVYVEPFWMDIYPVTVAQYARYIEATGAVEPKFWRDPQLNGAEQPVVGVSWEEACAYASWAGKQLPTEAQWEFAARGKENRKYPWGSLPPDATRCNFNNNLGMPSIVTMYEEGKTPEGIFDMAGNVYEWTLDPFRPYTLRRHTSFMPETSTRIAVRGGCYESPADELTTTARKGMFLHVRQRNIGFRCVIAP